MKTLIAALCGVLLSASMSLGQTWDVATMNREIEQTNFIVGDHCSATLISLNHRILLTNHHCVDHYITTVTKEEVDARGVVDSVRVEERKEVPVSQKVYKNFRMVSRSSWIAEILAYDEGDDLAIVQIISDIPHTVKADIFTGSAVYRGETVFAVGNPMGLDLSVTKGVISSTNRLLNVGGVEHPYYQMDAGIAGGSSGGSLYNANGELIGVPGASARGTAIALAIPYTVIQAFLTENCYEDIFDADAVPHDVCMAKDEED